MTIPVVMAYRLPNVSLSCILLLSMGMVLTVAVMLGWFQVSKKKVIFGLWGSLLGLPLLLLGIVWKANMLAPYQIKRITAFFTGGDEYNSITSVLRLNLQKSQLWGSNGEELKYFFEISDSYLFSHVLSVYGQILAVVILGILICLILQIFLLSFQQKNQELYATTLRATKIPKIDMGNPPQYPTKHNIRYSEHKKNSTIHLVIYKLCVPLHSLTALGV